MRSAQLGTCHPGSGNGELAPEAPGVPSLRLPCAQLQHLGGGLPRAKGKNWVQKLMFMGWVTFCGTQTLGWT